jgi:hypothetical protein
VQPLADQGDLVDPVDRLGTAADVARLRLERSQRHTTRGLQPVGKSSEVETVGQKAQGVIEPHGEDGFARHCERGVKRPQHGAIAPNGHDIVGIAHLALAEEPSELADDVLRGRLGRGDEANPHGREAFEER